MEVECEFKDKILEMHKAIYGNGNPEHGLLWIAKDNQRMISSNTKFIEFVKKHFYKILIGCGIGVGSAVLNLVFSLFKNHILIQ